MTSVRWGYLRCSLAAVGGANATTMEPGQKRARSRGALTQPLSSPLPVHGMASLDAADGDSPGENDAEEDEKHRSGAVENPLESGELGEKHGKNPVLESDHPAGVASYLDGA